MASPSRRPYLIRAIYDWATDNSLTPHLLVAADAPGVVVPREYVQDGRITLNISWNAVQTLKLDQEPIFFSARFSGRAFEVVIPSGAVLAVFARENGEGILFGEAEDMPTPTTGTGAGMTVADTSPPKPSGPPKLRIVK